MTLTLGKSLTGSRWTGTPSPIALSSFDAGVAVITSTRWPRAVSSRPRSRICISSPPMRGKYQSLTRAILMASGSSGDDGEAGLVQDQPLRTPGDLRGPVAVERRGTMHAPDRAIGGACLLTAEFTPDLVHAVL